MLELFEHHFCDGRFDVIRCRYPDMLVDEMPFLTPSPSATAGLSACGVLPVTERQNFWQAILAKDHKSAGVSVCSTRMSAPDK